MYHDTLGKVLNEYHLDVNDIYSFETFQKELVQFSHLGILPVMLFLRLMTVTADYAINVQDIYKGDTPLIDELCDGMKFYEKRLNDAINDFVKYGYL